MAGSASNPEQRLASSGLLTWSEIWCDVDNSKRFRSSCSRHVSQGHRLKGVAALHNFLAFIFTAPGVTTWRDLSGNTRKNQVTRLVTLRYQSTMSGALILQEQARDTRQLRAFTPSAAAYEHTARPTAGEQGQPRLPYSQRHKELLMAAATPAVLRAADRDVFGPLLAHARCCGAIGTRGP